MDYRVADIGDAQLEVRDGGTGEPVVFVQTALTADELVPLASQPSFEKFRTILYHRRGYAGSSAVDRPGSIARDAVDCARLLAVLGVERAHVVGYSYSGAVALQLSADAPDLVQTLTLIEPPPVHTASADEFRAANERLISSWRERGPAAALDEFLSLVIGPAWRTVTERAVTGSADQMVQDADTFFATDLPALLDWRFTAADAQRIRCPVLYVGGSASGPWFDRVRDLIQEWLPAAEAVIVEGADHSLSLTHTAQLAAAIGKFLRRHPMDPSG